MCCTVGSKFGSVFGKALESIALIKKHFTRVGLEIWYPDLTSCSFSLLPECWANLKLTLHRVPHYGGVWPLSNHEPKSNPFPWRYFCQVFYHHIRQGTRTQKESWSWLHMCLCPPPSPRSLVGSAGKTHMQVQSLLAASAFIGSSPVPRCCRHKGTFKSLSHFTRDWGNWVTLFVCGHEI